MKPTQIAKRLRARSDEKVSAERARLLADVLQEVADQVSPPLKSTARRTA
jgi:hypothetical protein